MVGNLYNANIKYTCTQSKGAQENAGNCFTESDKSRTAFFFSLKMYTCTHSNRKKEAIFITDANGRINQEKGIIKRDTSGQA